MHDDEDNEANAPSIMLRMLTGLASDQGRRHYTHTPNDTLTRNVKAGIFSLSLSLLEHPQGSPCDNERHRIALPVGGEYPSDQSHCHGLQTGRTSTVPWRSALIRLCHMLLMLLLALVAMMIHPVKPEHESIQKKTYQRAVG